MQIGRADFCLQRIISVISIHSSFRQSSDEKSTGWRWRNFFGSQFWDSSCARSMRSRRRGTAQNSRQFAPRRPGAATLAHIARVPILPCVIVGSDRLYAKRSWLPFRRTPIWIAFGDPISDFPELRKSDARERIEHKLTAAFKSLYAELRERFQL